MSESIYLLDFRHGVVKEINETDPPRGVRSSERRSEPETLPETAGFVLAALGTPPAPENEG